MKATHNQEGYIVINGGRSWNKNLLYINRFNKKNIFTEKKIYFTFNGHINRQALIFDYLIRKSVYSYEINKEILT